MSLLKSLKAVQITDWREPSRQVKDLLMDYGNIEQRDDSVWLTLHRKRLPSYLHGLDIVNEARRWVLVIISRGRACLKFRRGKSRFLKALRIQT